MLPQPVFPFIFKAVVAQWHKLCTWRMTNHDICGFDSHAGMDYYLWIFLFLRSGKMLNMLYPTRQWLMLLFQLLLNNFCNNCIVNLLKFYKAIYINNSFKNVISHTSWGIASSPGNAAIPVMKSLVMKGRSTRERWHDGALMPASRSKCTGMRMTGIWAMRGPPPLDISIWGINKYILLVHVTK